MIQAKHSKVDGPAFQRQNQRNSLTSGGKSSELALFTDNHPTTPAADADTASRCYRRRCPDPKHAPHEAERTIFGSACAWRSHRVYFFRNGAIAAIPAVAGSLISGSGPYRFSVCDPNIYAQLDTE